MKKKNMLAFDDKLDEPVKKVGGTCLGDTAESMG